jgi:hypothetical protein
MPTSTRRTVCVPYATVTLGCEPQGATGCAGTMMAGTWLGLGLKTGASTQNVEKPNLLQPSPDQPEAQHRRPADVFLPSWTGGASAALDLGITNPQRIDLLTLAAQQAGTAETAYELVKRNHMTTAADCQSQGMSYIPIVGEPSGGWGPSALCAFKALARAVCSHRRRSKSNSQPAPPSASPRNSQGECPSNFVA